MSFKRVQSGSGTEQFESPSCCNGGTRSSSALVMDQRPNLVCFAAFGVESHHRDELSDKTSQMRTQNPEPRIQKTEPRIRPGSNIKGLIGVGIGYKWPALTGRAAADCGLGCPIWRAVPASLREGVGTRQPRQVAGYRRFKRLPVQAPNPRLTASLKAPRFGCPNMNIVTAFEVGARRKSARAPTVKR